MALNAWESNNTEYTVPSFHYQFTNTWAVRKSDTPHKIASHVAAVAAGMPGGFLHALVLNCHGYAGQGHNTPKGQYTGGFGLYMGRNGILQKDLSLFSALKPNNFVLVKEIHITACGISKMSNLGISGDGDRYCWTLAQMSGAIVYGAIGDQVGESNSLPYNAIDDYEGIVKRYFPDDRPPEVWDKSPSPTMIK